MSTTIATTLRSLPIPVPPVGSETVASYLRRLEAVNHLHRDELDIVLHVGPSRPRLYRPAMPDAAVLSRLTGYSSQRLRQALPELRDTGPQKGGVRGRVACPRCCRRHRGGPVMLVHPEHWHLCLRHDIWLGSTGPASNQLPDPPGPVDVHMLPVVHRAQRRHVRLVRIYGEVGVAKVIRWAVDIWGRMNSNSHVGEHEWARLQRLCPGTDRVSLRDPAFAAVRYPEIVTLASVIITPRWQALGAEPGTRRHAYAEVERRLGLDWHEYNWEPDRQHPLETWAAGARNWTRDDAERAGR